MRNVSKLFNRTKIIRQNYSKTHIPNLDLITSGPVSPSSERLIISRSMKEMIDELKPKYDYIILDTPPVELVSDALELAQYCDATLYVVRQAITKIRNARCSKEKHKRGELHNISIVLNDFQNKLQYRYGYGYRSYAYENEEAKPKNKLLN